MFAGLSLTADSRQPATWFVCAGYFYDFCDFSNYFVPLPGQVWLYGSFRIAVQQYGNLTVALE